MSNICMEIYNAIHSIMRKHFLSKLNLYILSFLRKIIPLLWHKHIAYLIFVLEWYNVYFTCVSTMNWNIATTRTGWFESSPMGRLRRGEDDRFNGPEIVVEPSSSSQCNYAARKRPSSIHGTRMEERAGGEITRGAARGSLFWHSYRRIRVW